MNKLCHLFSILLACSISLSAAAAVTSSVDRNNIASGETLRLILEFDGRTDQQPDLDPLRKDFDILGRSSGSRMQIINGTVTSQTQFSVILAPKRDGKLQIPGLQWDGQMSEPLELTVGGTGNTNSSGNPVPTDTSHIFFTTTLDQKQPYVQAAVVMLMRLYTDQPLYQASLDFPTTGDVQVKQIGKDREITETRNGRNYQIIERKYLLFPQRSGKISLKGPVLEAEVPDTTRHDPFGNDPFFGNLFQRMPLSTMMNATRSVRVNAKPIELTVKPRPTLAKGTSWIPARSLKLEESWQPDTKTIRVGEPLTRHLQVSALGLTGAQLPDLGTLVSVPDGIKAYPDQPKVSDTTQGNTVLGSQEQNIALIASQPGQYELPAVRLSWWDTLKDEPRVATLPGLQLEVLPAAGNAGVVMPPTIDTLSSSTENRDDQSSPAEKINVIFNNTPWLWISVALLVLWLMTVFAWWYSRKRVPVKPSDKVVEENQPFNINGTKAFKAFKRACQNNEPNTARQQLIAWASTVWPKNPPLGLNELARRLDDAKLTLALRELDRACYQGGAWNGEVLVQSLSEPPAQSATTKKASELPELYP